MHYAAQQIQWNTRGFPDYRPSDYRLIMTRESSLQSADYCTHTVLFIPILFCILILILPLQTPEALRGIRRAEALRSAFCDCRISDFHLYIARRVAANDGPVKKDFLRVAIAREEQFKSGN